MSSISLQSALHRTEDTSNEEGTESSRNELICCFRKNMARPADLVSLNNTQCQKCPNTLMYLLEERNVAERQEKSPKNGILTY